MSNPSQSGSAATGPSELSADSPPDITVSPSEQPSAAQSRGPSVVCWATNLSAFGTQCVTLYYLGVPLLATFTEALKANPRDLATMVISGVAFLAIVRSSSLGDVAKVITAAKGLLPGGKP